MKIQNVSDAAFKKYGKVITGLDCSDIYRRHGGNALP